MLFLKIVKIRYIQSSGCYTVGNLVIKGLFLQIIDLYFAFQTILRLLFYKIQLPEVTITNRGPKSTVQRKEQQCIA